MPKVFGIVQETGESWDREHLLAIDSQFIPENNSDIQGVPDWSAKEILHRLERIRAPVVVSHVSAARLLGLPLPYRIATDPNLHITVSRSRARPHQAGIRTHLGDLVDPEVVVTNGVHITTPARIVTDLSGVLNLSELNVLFDAVQAPHVDQLLDRAVDQTFGRNSGGALTYSEFAEIMLRRDRFPGRTNVLRLLELREQHWLPSSDYPWQSFVAATIASASNTSIKLLSPEQLAVPAHNVIVVRPWHFDDDRDTAMTLAATITALRSFGWCADSFSYRDLLSVDSVLYLYAKTRNRSEFAHMRLHVPQMLR